MSDVPRAGDPSTEHHTFSLVQGGPLYQLLRRLRLSGADLQMLRRRVAVILAVLWLPPLLLAIVEGHAWGGAGVPFLADIGMQVRFLIALPLLLAAERAVHQQMVGSIPLFIKRGIVDDAHHARFAEAIASARRTLHSIPLELALLAFVYVLGFSGALLELSDAAWHSTITDGRRTTTWAGWWLTVVSLPLFQFLLLRWYVRLLVWWRFLWQVSRLRLKLQPLLPDRLGGLGFVSRLSAAFAPLLLAQSALASALIADQVFYARASLSDFPLEIAGVGIFLLATILVPLFAFAPCLARAKLDGLAAMEVLTMRTARQFSRKWLRPHATGEPSLPDDPDLHSLADLRDGYELVCDMRLVPIGMPALTVLVVAALAPMLPLLLTTFSPMEMMSGVAKLLF